MAKCEKRDFSELKRTLDFWLDVRDDSIIYDYMKENGVDRLTVEVASTYVFELKDDG